MQVLRAGVKAIFDAIARGMVLAVPFDSSEPIELIPTPLYFVGRALPERVEVNRIDAAEAIGSGLMRQLTEGRNDCIVGWRENHLPGESYALYVMKQ